MMTAKNMANAIKNSGIKECKDAASALQKFWKAVCDYVSQNANVYYSWTAALTVEPFTVDPTLVMECKVNASGTLSPCHLTDNVAALSAMSTQMNANAATWTITPKNSATSSFSVTPMFIIPSINLSVSKINDPDSALEFICNQIIMGIKMATPANTGSHIVTTLTFAGAGTFTNII